MNLKIGLYAFCAQQMLMDRNTCVITIIKDICVSKCGRNFLKTRRYDSVLSPLFLFFNLIKTVAKFMRTESVKCPAHAVSQARAYYVTQFTYKSEKPTDLNYSISRVSYVHSSRTTDESLHFFVLPSENQNAFARSADFEFQFILYSRNETARHFVRSDFLQRYTQNFEIRRRVPRVKNQQTDENQHTHTHTHTPLLVDPPMQCLL